MPSVSLHIMNHIDIEHTMADWGKQRETKRESIYVCVRG